MSRPHSAGKEDRLYQEMIFVNFFFFDFKITMNGHR